MQIQAAVQAIVLVATALTPTGPLSSLGFLVGTWSCQGIGPGVLSAVREPYGVTFAYDAGGYWLRETDVDAGFSSTAMISYDADQRAFLLVRLGVGCDRAARQNRAMIRILRSTRIDLSHLEYHRVYPDTAQIRLRRTA